MVCKTISAGSIPARDSMGLKQCVLCQGAGQIAASFFSTCRKCNGVGWLFQKMTEPDSLELVQIPTDQAPSLSGNDLEPVCCAYKREAMIKEAITRAEEYEVAVRRVHQLEKQLATALAQMNIKGRHFPE
jgi:hypothetical protein